ncbi:MAG: Uncharacterized MFS-type transporter, partial [uncultured Blastococcus sp.]
ARLPPPAQGRRLLVRGGAPGAHAGRVGRAVAALPRLPGGVRLQLRRPHDDLRGLLLRPARLAPRRRRAVGPRRPAAGAGGRLRPGGRRDGAVPPGRRRRLAAHGPRGAGAGDRSPDQHPGSHAAGPAAPRPTPRRVRQQRLPGPGPLGRCRRCQPAGPAGHVAHRLGVRRPDRRLPAGRRRDPGAAGELAADAGSAALAAAAGPRAGGEPAGLRRHPADHGRLLGRRRAVRLARAVVGRRRLRHRQPPRRRAADPRAQRHGRPRVTGAAYLAAGPGAADRHARLHRRNGGHHRVPVRRVGPSAVHRRGRRRLRVRWRLPRRGRPDHVRRPAGAPGRPHVEHLRRRVPGLQHPGDRRRRGRRRDRPRPDHRDLRHRRRRARPARRGRPAADPPDRRLARPRRARRDPDPGSGAGV